MTPQQHRGPGEVAGEVDDALHLGGAVRAARGIQVRHEHVELLPVTAAQTGTEHSTGLLRRREARVVREQVPLCGEDLVRAEQRDPVAAPGAAHLGRGQVERGTEADVHPQQLAELGGLVRMAGALAEGDVDLLQADDIRSERPDLARGPGQVDQAVTAEAVADVEGRDPPRGHPVTALICSQRPSDHCVHLITAPIGSSRSSAHCRQPGPSSVFSEA